MLGSVATALVARAFLSRGRPNEKERVMENNSFCQRVIEAANARPGKVAMTLIGTDDAEKELSH
jgi:hypothetical protein